MSSDSPEKESLASTACWIAAVRAQESERVDRLFDDPWATLLAGQAGQDWIERIDLFQARLERMSKDYRISLQWGKPGQKWSHPRLRFETTIPDSPANPFTRDQEHLTDVGIVIRTKFFDNFLLHATREHQIHQVVILASGMDTRGFRLTWPLHTRLFEVDQPRLLLQKRQLLFSAGASPTCSRWSIGADLVHESWSATLMRAGFDPHRTTVWLIEGLLPYLSESAVQALLKRVTTLSAPGSWLGFTAVNSKMLTSSTMRFWLEFLEDASTPWLSAMDEPESLLAEHGWIATVVQPGEASANFDRWPYPVAPRSIPNLARAWLVTAVKHSPIKG